MERALLTSCFVQLAKRAQKWVCGVCESISEGAGAQGTLLQLGVLPARHCSLTAASPGGKDSQCIRHPGLNLPPSSAGVPVEQLSSHSCALMSKMTVTVCWGNIWGLLDCVFAWFWILLCVSVFPMSGFNAAEHSEISLDMDSNILVIWLQCMPWIAGTIVFPGQSCVHTNERSFTPHVWFASPFHLSRETNDSSRSAEISSSPDLGQDLRVVTQKFLFWAGEKDLWWTILFQFFSPAVCYKYICVIRGPSSNVVKIQVGTFIVSSKRKQPVSSSSGFSLPQLNIYCFM